MATSTRTRRKLTVGKVAGLRRLADDRGIFLITAMDQRNSLRVMLNAASPDSVPAQRITEIKLALAGVLSPHSTAILIDPQYGAAQAIASGDLDGHAGLIVTLEADKPKTVGQGRITQIAPGLSAEKIKRLGGDGVKLLVRYRPDLADPARENREVVEEVAAQCRAADIPFVLETLAYAVEGQSKEDFAKEKPSLVIQTAKEMSGYCDLYKAEFPADISYHKEVAAQRQYCHALNDAIAVPWVILSAGADIGPFMQQVDIACQAGASGFLAGRAIWKDYVRIEDPGTRRSELERKAVHNLGVITHIAKREATPWTEHPGIQIPTPMDYSPTWYERY
jgi:tagatose 1,6-diphosphate aldolase